MRGIPFSDCGDSAGWRGVPHKTGGGTSSSSSSNVQDQRAAVGGDGLLASNNSTINFSIDNPDGFAQLLTTGAGVFEAALEFANNQTEMSAAAYGKALDAVQASKQSEETNFGLAAIKSAGPLLLIAGLVFAMSKG